MSDQRVERAGSRSRSRRWARVAIGTLIVMLTGIGAWAIIFAAAWEDPHTTMDTVLLVLGMIILVFLTIFVIGVVRIWRARRRYAALQASRSPLTDEEFCHGAGFGSADEGVVFGIRSALAERGGGRHDASRIYPEDSPAVFGLGYDDDLDWFVDGTDLIPGFQPGSYSIPVEEVASVADLVRVVQRMKDEAAAGTPQVGPD